MHPGNAVAARYLLLTATQPVFVLRVFVETSSENSPLISFMVFQTTYGCLNVETPEVLGTRIIQRLYNIYETIAFRMCNNVI